MQRSVRGEVVASTLTSHHHDVQVAEMVIEKAKRLVVAERRGHFARLDHPLNPRL